MAPRDTKSTHAAKHHAAAIKPALDQFHQALGEANLGHVRVHSLTLAPAAHPGDSNCPPGSSWVCEPTPEGGINCYCKPDSPG